MSRDMMTKIVNIELKHIPKGDLPQKLLRFRYNMVRRNHLSISENTPKEMTLLECITKIKEKHLDFQPEYDATFFKFRN